MQKITVAEDAETVLWTYKVLYSIRYYQEKDRKNHKQKLGDIFNLA